MAVMTTPIQAVVMAAAVDIQPQRFLLPLVPPLRYVLVALVREVLVRVRLMRVAAEVDIVRQPRVQKRSLLPAEAAAEAVVLTQMLKMAVMGGREAVRQVRMVA